LPRIRANWNPAASVTITSVGMSSTIFGMNRLENSTRACTDMRRRIGPMTKPTNRSTLVQSAPPATWKKSSAHSLLLAIAATSAPRTATTIGIPANGTIVLGTAVPGAAAGGPAVSTRSVASAIDHPFAVGADRSKFLRMIRGDSGSGPEGGLRQRHSYDVCSPSHEATADHDRRG